MHEYWLIMFMLLAVGSLFVIWPMWSTVSKQLGNNNSHALDNIGLFKQQQAALAIELAASNISAQDHATHLAELERSLLLDLQTSNGAQQRYTHGGRVVLMIVVLLVPIVGWFTYQTLGASHGLQQRDNMLATRALMRDVTNSQQMLTALQEHLQTHPNNPEGWYLLANIYMETAQLPMALKAFEQALQYAVADTPQRAAILGQYAQALFFADGAVSDRTQQAMQKAMELDPNNISVLSLLGIQAFEQGRYERATQFWQQALDHTESEDSVRALTAGIASATAQLEAANAVPEGPSIMVKVRLANGLHVPEDPRAVLFVYARVPGQRMPLLATRLDPQQLPVQVRLSSAQALQSNINLTNYPSLSIVAHIAKAGTPGSQAGDLASQPMLVSMKDIKVVNLVIDHIVTP